MIQKKVAEIMVRGIFLVLMVILFVSFIYYDQSWTMDPRTRKDLIEGLVFDDWADLTRGDLLLDGNDDMYIVTGPSACLKGRPPKLYVREVYSVDGVLSLSSDRISWGLSRLNHSGLRLICQKDEEHQELLGGFK